MEKAFSHEAYNICKKRMQMLAKPAKEAQMPRMIEQAQTPLGILLQTY